MLGTRFVYQPTSRTLMPRGWGTHYTWSKVTVLRGVSSGYPNSYLREDTAHVSVRAY